MRWNSPLHERSLAVQRVEETITGTHRQRLAG
jgi:hypothetical protein